MQDSNSILGYTLEELERFFEDQKIQKYRAKQILQWIYEKQVFDFAQMTNLSKELRNQLAALFTIQETQVVHKHPGHDGTTKLAIQLADKNIIEAVYIPEGNRFTGCISTQVGCPLDCQFCASAYAPYKRNLKVHEIIEQIWHVAALSPEKRLTNVVLMGIGEPLLNPNLYKFLSVLCSPWGGNFSPRRITLSTAGMVPKISQLADSPVSVNLAISLHAPEDRLRNQIMPKVTYSIKETLEAARYYQNKTKRMITFEYILLEHLNDNEEHAHALAMLLKGFQCKVNLIPYNPIPNLSFKTPSKERIDQFVAILEDNDVAITTRKRKGRDVKAACGQLRIHMEKSK